MGSDEKSEGRNVVPRETAMLLQAACDQARAERDQWARACEIAVANESTRRAERDDAWALQRKARDERDAARAERDARIQEVTTVLNQHLETVTKLDSLRAALTVLRDECERKSQAQDVTAPGGAAVVVALGMVWSRLDAILAGNAPAGVASEAHAKMPIGSLWQYGGAHRMRVLYHAFDEAKAAHVVVLRSDLDEPVHATGPLSVWPIGVADDWPRLPGKFTWDLLPDAPPPPPVVTAGWSDHHQHCKWRSGKPCNCALIGYHGPVVPAGAPPVDWESGARFAEEKARHWQSIAERRRLELVKLGQRIADAEKRAEMAEQEREAFEHRMTGAHMALHTTQADRDALAAKLEDLRAKAEESGENQGLPAVSMARWQGREVAYRNAIGMVAALGTGAASAEPMVQPVTDCEQCGEEINTTCGRCGSALVPAASVEALAEKWKRGARIARNNVLGLEQNRWTANAYEACSLELRALLPVPAARANEARAIGWPPGVSQVRERDRDDEERRIVALYGLDRDYSGAPPGEKGG